MLLGVVLKDVRLEVLLKWGLSDPLCALGVSEDLLTSKNTKNLLRRDTQTGQKIC